MIAITKRERTPYLQFSATQSSVGSVLSRRSLSTPGLEGRRMRKSSHTKG